MRTPKDSDTEVVLPDTNYLIADLRSTDTEHPRAELIDEVLEEIEPEFIYLDCIFSEVISVLARQYAEEGELEKFPGKAEELKGKFWSRIVWMAYAGGELLLERAIDICKEAAERYAVGISPHDAMLLLFAREKGIRYIISFDEDLGKVRRIEGKKLRTTVIDDQNRDELRGPPRAT